MIMILQKLFTFLLPRKVDQHPNRLLNYDLEDDLTNLHLINFKLPSIEKVGHRHVINIIFDVFCWINSIKVVWFYWIDIPMAKRFGDLSLFYGESRYYGLAYDAIGFTYINVTYFIAHFDHFQRKCFHWFRNYNQIFQSDHHYVNMLNRSRWNRVRKLINLVYIYLWIFTRFLVLPAATVIYLSPMFMVDHPMDLLTNVPAAFLACWAGFYAYNLVRMSVFLGISYSLIMHYSLELNLDHLRKLQTRKTIAYSQVQTFFHHYLAIYNEAFEANKFMSKLTGVLYSGTFLESLVCMYVSFIAPSPLSTRIIFLGLLNVHVTLNIIIITLTFIYPQRLVSIDPEYLQENL